MPKPSRCHISKRHCSNRNQTSYSNSHNEYRLCQDPCSKKSPKSSVKVGCCKHHHCKCIPRKGELVRNGGFEAPNPFFNWVINSGVDIIDPSMGDTAHHGSNAARLGFIEPQAVIYQDVPGICPGNFYQLSFFMSTAKNLCNASVNVRLEFLDKFMNPIGAPVLDFIIPQNSLFESYGASIRITRWPSPHAARFIRVLFATDTGADADGYVRLDDVSLVAL